MNESIILLIGIEMVNQMEDKDIFDRFERATTESDKIAVVQETEKMAFNVSNKLFKKDSELNGAEIKAKNEILKAVIEHQYEFFEMKTPFENGLTFEDIQARNGIFVQVPEDEEFFI